MTTFGRARAPLRAMLLASAALIVLPVGEAEAGCRWRGKAIGGYMRCDGSVAQAFGRASRYVREKPFEAAMIAAGVAVGISVIASGATVSVGVGASAAGGTATVPVGSIGGGIASGAATVAGARQADITAQRGGRRSNDPGPPRLSAPPVSAAAPSQVPAGPARSAQDGTPPSPAGGQPPRVQDAVRNRPGLPYEHEMPLSELLPRVESRPSSHEPLPAPPTLRGVAPVTRAALDPLADFLPPALHSRGYVPGVDRSIAHDWQLVGEKLSAFEAALRRDAAMSLAERERHRDQIARHIDEASHIASMWRAAARPEKAGRVYADRMMRQVEARLAEERLHADIERAYQAVQASPGSEMHGKPPEEFERWYRQRVTEANGR